MPAGRCHVIIVGGGASGALQATAILRDRPDLRVTLIENRADVGPGFAYGEAQPFHLLNVRAANLSADASDPRHFIDWLERNGFETGDGQTGAFRFAPRHAYGRYLSEVLGAAAAASDNPDTFTHVRALATTIERTCNGICVGLEDGRRMAADAGVIATGYEPPRYSRFLAGHTPWSAFDKRQLERAEHVLIVGTSHTAIDHILWLDRVGFEGTITAISRHGLLPQVHRPVETVTIDATDIPFGAPVSRLWRWARDRADAAAAEGVDWRSVFDGVRPHAQAIWQALPLAEQRRFIRHACAHYDVRRHRMAPSVAAELERLIGAGRLKLVAGKVKSVRSLADRTKGAEVIICARGAHSDTAMAADIIIECTGVNLDVRSSTNRLLRNLIAQGLGRPNRHGQGLDVAASCAIIDAQGRAAPNLYAIGPLTRGQFWEATGIPEIRRQSTELARVILQA